MAGGLFVLVLLCFVMAVASFLAGSLPLFLSLSSRQLRLISALGTGVLVGTSLIVIIPEGVETLYSGAGSSHGHDKRAVGSAFSNRSISVVDYHASATWPRDTAAHPANILPAAQNLRVAARTPSDDSGSTSDSPSSEMGHEEGIAPPTTGSDAESPSYSSSPPTYDPHSWIGISLISGFILMYLIDTLPKQASTASQPARFHISLNQFSFNRRRRTSSAHTLADEPPDTPTMGGMGISDSFDDHLSSSSSFSRPSSTTVGLVIHATADGIALGASSSDSSTNRLSFIIFLALMIHKAPAAFGLTSVLLKQGLTKRAARAHLIVFSLAAPAGALATWFAAHILGYSYSSPSSADGTTGASSEFATGALLLFSAGTFLYVAMHTMQDRGGHDGAGLGASGGGAGPGAGAGVGGHHHASRHHMRNASSHMNGYGGGLYSDAAAASLAGGVVGGGGGGALGGKDGGAAAAAFTDTLVTVAGMLLPLLTQFGHGH